MPRKTGHWCVIERDYMTCSECGGFVYTGIETTSKALERLKTFHMDWRYCPFCGVGMKEKEKGKGNGKRKKERRVASARQHKGVA